MTKGAFLLFILCLGYTSAIYAQVFENFENAIIEVYIDNETVETYDYKLIIISKDDTLRPEVFDKYFIPTIKLDTFVTFIVSYKGNKVTIPRIENIFLYRWSYIKVIISTHAVDTCAQLNTQFADMYKSYISDCEVFHEVTFEKLNRYNYKDFYQKWKDQKSEKFSK